MTNEASEREALSIEWRDSDNVQHWATPSHALEILRLFYDEWPGGVDEFRAWQARAAAPAVHAPVAWVTGLQWKPRQTEQVVKLTRETQPEYGYTVPLYAAAPTAAQPNTDGVAIPQSKQEN
jgi:hypothetical protein